MRTRRRRRRRSVPVTTPRGNLYVVPTPTPIACLAPVDPLTTHLQYMKALLAERPTIGLALLVQTARFAKQFTRQFGGRVKDKAKRPNLIAVCVMLGSVC